MRYPRPTFRLSLVMLFIIGLALMWWWPTRAPEDGALTFPPIAPPLPEATDHDAASVGAVPTTRDGG